MKQGIYIFNNETDFLKVLKEIANHYTEKQDLHHLYKFLTSATAVKQEIDYLNTCKLNSYQGFKTDAVIKINITDKYNCNYLISYLFNHSNSNGAYYLFYKYLRKRENIYI